MANSDWGFNVSFTTTADTSGADATLDALKKVEDEAAAANAAQPGANPASGGEQYSGAELEQIQEKLQLKLNEKLVEQELLQQVAQARVEEQGITDVMRQRQTIATMLVEAAQEEAVGHLEVAAAMRGEVEAMQLSLTYQTGAKIPQAEALSLAKQRIAAEAQITAQDRAQAALNAELIAQEEAKLAVAEAQSKVYGRGGQTGNLLKNAGVDAGLATTIGIAVLAGTELNRQINEMARSYDEARLTAEKQSAELEKQIDQWKTMASVAQNMNDVVKVTDSVNKGLEALTEKLRDVKGEGSGGFFQNMTDGLKGWSNTLGDAYQKMLVNNGTITQSTSDQLIQQGHLKTSTEEAQAAIIEQQASLIKAGQVYEDFAKKQAAWFESLKAQPVADQISALIAKEGELIEKQQGVQEGTKAWANYQKQIDEVVKAEEKAIEAQNRDINTLQKLDDQITKTSADLAKLYSEQPAKGSQNDFVKVDNESIGGAKSSGFFHPSDTTTNAAGNVISKSGATPIDPNDPALKAFLEVAEKIDSLTSKLGDLTTHRDAVKNDLSKPAPKSSAVDDLTNRATPDADEADFQDTLDQRAVSSAAEGVSTAANADAAAAKASLDSAGQAFAQIPDHFAAFQATITESGQSLATQATQTNTELAGYFASVNEGIDQIGQTASDGLKDLQAQITRTNQQLQSYIDAQNT